MKGNISSRRGLRCLVAAVAVLTVGGCSDSKPSSGAPQGSGPSAARTKDAVKFFMNTGEDTKLVSVGPDPSLWTVAGAEPRDDGSPELLRTRGITTVVDDTQGTLSPKATSMSG